MRKRKAAGVVSLFLQQQYGIRWKDISSKLRTTLLAEVERVTCNLCGSDESEPVATRDKYRLPLTTVICRNCGLLYLNPRPTAATYGKFYEAGGQHHSIYHRRVRFDVIDDLLKVYYGPDFVMDEQARAAMAQFMAARGIGANARKARADSPTQGTGSRGDLSDAEKQGGEGQDSSTVADQDRRKIDYYGQHLYDELKEFVPAGGKVFEVGASWGKLLWPWKVLHGCEATGVEPKIEAVRDAKERFGLDLLQGFANDPRIPESTYDLVFNTRTINHMLDPFGDLCHAWRSLKPGGILFVDIADAARESRFEGLERNVIEIDHPYMFSLNTLSAMVQKAGFAIEKREITDLQRVRDWDDRPPQAKQIRIIARKSMDPVDVDWPDPMAELAALMQAQLEFDRDECEKYLQEHARYRQLSSRYKKLRTEHARLQKEKTPFTRRTRAALARRVGNLAAPLRMLRRRSRTTKP